MRAFFCLSLINQSYSHVSDQSVLHTSSYIHLCLSPANQCSTHCLIFMSICLWPINAPHILLFSCLLFSVQSVLYTASYFNICFSQAVSVSHVFLLSCLIVSGHSVLHTSSFSHVFLSPANQCSMCPHIIMLASYSLDCLSLANPCSTILLFTCPPFLTSDCPRPVSASHVLLFSHYFVSSQSVIHA